MQRQLIPLLAIILILTACSSGEDKNQQDKGLNAATLVEVIIARPSEVTEKVKTTGNLIANESTQLSPEVGGIVENIYFEEGTFITKGSALLSLINQDLEAELEEVKARKKLAEKQFRRSQNLFKAKGVSQETVDHAQTDYEEVQATYEKLEAEIKKTQVTAPFEGIIGLRNVSKGDYLAPDKSFASLVDVTPIKIEFSLPEKFAGLLKQGDSIEFTTPALSKPKKALVYAVEPQVNLSSRTINAKARYHNHDQSLLPGSFVNLSYQVESFEQAIVVPNQAIIPELDGKKVFLIKNGKVKSQDIVTGIRMADQIQVLKGLSKGDTVVTSGLLQIRDGIPVRIRMDESYVSTKKNSAE